MFHLVTSTKHLMHIAVLLPHFCSRHNQVNTTIRNVTIKPLSLKSRSADHSKRYALTYYRRFTTYDNICHTKIASIQCLRIRIAYNWHLCQRFAKICRSKWIRRALQNCVEIGLYGGSVRWLCGPKHHWNEYKSCSSYYTPSSALCMLQYYQWMLVSSFRCWLERFCVCVCVCVRACEHWNVCNLGFLVCQPVIHRAMQASNTIGAIHTNSSV